MLKPTKFIASVIAAAAITFSGGAQAATLATIVHDYGKGPGQVDPGGNDTLLPNAVVVSDQSSSRFNDAFDFSGLAYDSIDSFELTLDFSRAGPRVTGGFIPIPLELWSVRMQGSNSGSILDDAFRPLFSGASPQTFTIDGSSILAGDVFAHSVATEEFEFWFSEFSLGADAFRLNSASLTINGTPAAVPLPAGLPLLLAGLGALAAVRRRQTR